MVKIRMTVGSAGLLAPTGTQLTLMQEGPALYPRQSTQLFKGGLAVKSMGLG